MTADDLSTPLGQHRINKKAPALPGLVAPVIAGALGLCVLAFGGWVMFAEDPLGGEPVAVAAAHLATDAQAKKSEPAKAPGNAEGGAERPNRHDGLPTDGAP